MKKNKDIMGVTYGMIIGTGVGIIISGVLNICCNMGILLGASVGIVIGYIYDNKFKNK